MEEIQMDLVKKIRFLAASESTREVASKFADLSDQLFDKMVAKEKLTLEFKTSLIHHFLALNHALESAGFDKIKLESESEIASVYLKYYKEVIEKRI